MLTGMQCKIARSGLCLTQPELAELATVAIGTIVSFENGIRVPRALTLKSIMQVFSERGVVFTDDAVIIPLPEHQIDPASQT